jgi:phosphoribosyl-ATP pyrophosphohydrolase
MKDTLNELYDVVLSRKEEKTEGSYTCYLFEKGLDKILKKVGEECAETVIAAKNAEKSDGDEKAKAELVGEICDLYYHLTVMMAQLGITPDEINAELEKRSLKTGNLKTFHQTDKNT